VVECWLRPRALQAINLLRSSTFQIQVKIKQWVE
jgi:hypothetical protein